MDVSLSKLRDAVASGDWNRIGAALDRALMDLGCDGPHRCGSAVAFVEAEIRRVLPEFQKEEPSDTWVARKLARDLDADLWPPDYAGPGSNGFAKTVQGFDRARGEPYSSWVCRCNLVSAMLGLVMSECERAWGRAHPDEWAASYARAMSEVEEPEGSSVESDPMWNWFRDPAVIAVGRTVWAGIAERLAAVECRDREPA